MLNVGLNQVCAVYNVAVPGRTAQGTARDTILAAMQGRHRLRAAREGCDADRRDISAWMKMTDAFEPPAGLPSMRQDTLARRPTEVELFAGAMRRLGEKHGVPTP